MTGPIIPAEQWPELALIDGQANVLSSSEQCSEAVSKGEVLVTVSGFTGSGKSAVAGEIEILCKALGSYRAEGVGNG